MIRLSSDSGIVANSSISVNSGPGSLSLASCPGSFIIAPSFPMLARPLVVLLVRVPVAFSLWHPQRLMRQKKGHRTAGLPRLRSGRGHRCSRTATCRSPTCSTSDGDEITGVVDWSEAGQGDALYDLARLTLGHEEHLGDVVAVTAPTSTST